MAGERKNAPSGVPIKAKGTVLHLIELAQKAERERDTAQAKVASLTLALEKAREGLGPFAALTPTGQTVRIEGDWIKSAASALSAIEAVVGGENKDLSVAQDAVVGRGALPSPRQAACDLEGWRPISEARPEVGNFYVAWTVHQNARYSKDPVGEGWAAPTLIEWIDHNGGGWTWHGLAGEHLLFIPVPDPLPLPPPPAEGSPPADGALGRQEHLAPSHDKPCSKDPTR